MVQIRLPLPCIVIRPGGQTVKTSPFHGGNTGSIPVRVTSFVVFDVAFFVWGCFCKLIRITWTHSSVG